MKKLLCLLLCLTFAFTAAGCDLFKSDQEKYDELSAKFEQDAKAATTEKECEELGEKYIEAVPKDFKAKAKSDVTNTLFMFDMRKFNGTKLGDNSAKIANYPE